MYRLYRFFFAKLVKLFGKFVIILTDDKKLFRSHLPGAIAEEKIYFFP